MTVPGFNVVIDISHYSTIANLANVKKSGVLAVIHKATQSLTYRDKEYPDRRQKFKDAGLKWGSYHYATGADPLHQVENYLGYAKPTDDELICVDLEAGGSAGTMSYDQLLEFVEIIVQDTGRHPVIYGGNILRAVTKGKANSTLSNCSLWYARYADTPIGLPSLWPTWTLWQYTDGNHGPEPQTVRGIGNCDRDTFNGTEAEFAKSWPLTPAAVLA